jgi:hypothetical protein
MTAEDLVSELEAATSRLIVALLNGDHRFLEYFEQRRTTLGQIRRIPPGAIPRALVPRLEGALRAGRIVEARVRREQNEICLKLSKLERQPRGG